MSQNSGTGQPNRYATFDPRPSRHTTTGIRVTSFAYKEGGNSVPVLRCLETKEMQRVGVQCPGSRLPSSVPRVPPPPFVCRQGLYREAHSPPVTDIVHATKQCCRGSLLHYISQVLESPLPRDSSLHGGECGKHSAISPSRRRGHFHRSCGYLFPHTHSQRLPKMSSISDSGHHIPIPGTAVCLSPAPWVFSKIMTEIKMLVHVMGINLSQYLDDWLI